MNIGNVLKSAQRFATRNLSSGDDFGTVEGNRKEATRVDTEVGRINADTVEVQGKLETLKEDSKLAPPSFADVSNKQVLMGAASAGAVVGGAVGVLSDLASGGGAVNITERTVPIMSERLNGIGFDMSTYEVGSSTNLEGYDVENFRQRPLQQVKVGEYTERTASASAGNIAVAGLIGAGVGAGIGALAGLGVVGLRKALGKDHNGTPPRETEGDNKLLIAGGVAGAVVGGAAGALSSIVNSTTTSYETQSIPAMETKVLGQMPTGNGFFVPVDRVSGTPSGEQVLEWADTNTGKLADRGFRGADDLGLKDITGQVPKEELIGSDPKILTDKKEVSVGPGFLPSILGGMAVGAVTGVAGGVLVNVLRKTL